MQFSFKPVEKYESSVMLPRIQPAYNGKMAKEYYFDLEDPITATLTSGRFDKLSPEQLDIIQARFRFNEE